MLVAQFDRQTSAYRKNTLYIQPKGIVGCVKVSVMREGQIGAPIDRIEVALMPRNCGYDRQAEDALKALLNALGDTTYSLCTSMNSGLNLKEIQFLQNHGAIKRTDSSAFFGHTTISIGKLVTERLLDKDVSDKITQDISHLLKKAKRSDDIRTMPYSHALSPDRN